MFFEGMLETGYKYWINTNLLPDIDTNDWCWLRYWPGNFFDTKEERDLAIGAIKTYLKYKDYSSYLTLLNQLLIA